MVTLQKILFHIQKKNPPRKGKRNTAKDFLECGNITARSARKIKLQAITRSARGRLRASLEVSSSKGYYIVTK